MICRRVPGAMLPISRPPAAHKAKDARHRSDERLPQEEKQNLLRKKGAPCGNHHETTCAIANIPHPCAFVNRKNAHRLTRAMSVPLQNGGKDGMRRRPTNIFISVAAPLVPLVGSVHSRLAIATTRPAQPSRPDRATRQEHIPEGPTAFS